MLSESPALFYTLLDPLYFEHLSRYQPTDGYSARVRELLGDGWEIHPSGFWTQCTPHGVVEGRQGWKIHLSAGMFDAVRLLELVVPLFVEGTVSFKFCSDEKMHALSMNKNWPRTGAGKFVTVYPKDDDTFKDLLDRCYERTAGMSGPYILSDRPYKDSRVVYYRYGEHRGESRINCRGDRMAVVRAPDGTAHSDERRAFFSLPPWVSDPFTTEVLPASSPGTVLLHGRYHITRAIRFSSAGGIYIANDTQTGREVVIREARPFFGGVAGVQDAKVLLDKEARILTKLGPTGYTPKFIEQFDEWEHSFLVQERLEAESLWGYAINFTSKTEGRTAEETFNDIRRTIKTLADGLDVVHAHGVVLRDMTKTNVMFTKDDRVQFIDFELSFELDRDDPHVPGSTAGYASVQQRDNDRPTILEDYYAFGALILDMLTFTVVGYALHPEGMLENLTLQLTDLGLPHVLRDIVVGLTDPDAQRRWTLARVRQALDRAHVSERTRHVFASDRAARTGRLADDNALRVELSETLSGVAQWIESMPDYSRRDRLWPASGDVFRSGPLSIQYGASGVGYFLHETGRGVPAEAVSWMLDVADRRQYPSGLYLGLAGFALFLHDIGRPDDAARMMDRSRVDDNIFELPFLYEGAAGWGLANINLWERTGERVYLDDALRVGTWLETTAQRDAHGAFWMHDTLVPLGLGHGQAGVGLFLTFLFAATRDERWAVLARQAIDTELAERQDLNGKLLWFPQRNSHAGAPKSPHMRYGTAGVGSAILRLYAATGDADLRGFAQQCAESVVSRWTNKIWHDYGIAGYGEYLLDAHTLLADDQYLHDAFHVAKGLLTYRMPQAAGIAFPGSELLRLSCDFAQGSAGIGLFLNRLLDPTRRRILMPDALLVGTKTNVGTTATRPAGHSARSVSAKYEVLISAG